MKYLYILAVALLLVSCTSSNDIVDVNGTDSGSVTVSEVTATWEITTDEIDAETVTIKETTTSGAVIEEDTTSEKVTSTWEATTDEDITFDELESINEVLEIIETETK